MKKLAYIQKDDICIVSLPSQLNQHDYLGLRDYFKREFIQAGKLRIVLDCSELIDPPSIAYGVMCSVNRDLIRNGGKFAIGNIPKETHDIMERIHITNQVSVFTSDAEAIDHIKELQPGGR